MLLIAAGVIILTLGCVQKPLELEPTPTIAPVQPTTIISTQPEDYKIFLLSKKFVPAPGISPSAETNISTSPLERVHILIQFYNIPNNSEKESIEKLNIKLLTYIPNNAWFASIPKDSLTRVLHLPFVRWIGEILPEDKTSPSIKENKFGTWAVNPDESVNLIVEFFSDISLDKGEKVIKSYKGVVNSRVTSINALVVAVPLDAISKLANEDGVQLIDIVSPPPIAESNKSAPYAEGK